MRGRGRGLQSAEARGLFLLAISTYNDVCALEASNAVDALDTILAVSKLSRICQARPVIQPGSKVQDTVQKDILKVT